MSWGYIDNKKYGAAKPTPKEIKIGIVKFEDCINAYPRAAPINGAVHGDATITANTPVKNDPEIPLDQTAPSFVIEEPMFRSVNKTTPIKNIKMLKIPTMIGDWSWNPHPT